MSVFSSSCAKKKKFISHLMKKNVANSKVYILY